MAPALRTVQYGSGKERLVLGIFPCSMPVLYKSVKGTPGGGGGGGGRDGSWPAVSGLAMPVSSTRRPVGLIPLLKVAKVSVLMPFTKKVAIVKGVDELNASDEHVSNEVKPGRAFPFKLACHRLLSTP